MVLVFMGSEIAKGKQPSPVMIQLLAQAVVQQKPWRAMDLPVHDRRGRANNNTGETALINLRLKRCAQGIGTWRC